MNDLVSIIVPCYKQAHYLDQTLQSVIDQSFSSWECIIVNDGSPDNTEEIAKRWCAKDSRFKYLYKDNGGLCSARNAGIKISKGEYIVALDSDDVLHKDFLTRLLLELINDSTLAIVSCYRLFFANKITNVIYRHKPEGSTYHALLFENILMPSSIYRKKYWVEVGGYDEQMTSGFEDWEFWLAITKKGKRFKIVKEFLFYYRKSANSMLIDTLKNHRIDIMEYVFHKHKEVYIENYDNTIKYLFFLINLYRNSELKYKSSLEYKFGNFLCNPFGVFKRYKKKKDF